jgi:hypothetical protein
VIKGEIFNLQGEIFMWLIKGGIFNCKGEIFMWLWVYYLHRSDFYVALRLFFAQVKFLYAC